MPATNRCEKYKGFTLVVEDDWFTIVWDATGHEMSGPVSDEADVRIMALLAIPILPLMAKRKDKV